MFSRIAPGSTFTESRCSFETKRTSRLGGFACAQPSSPSPATACRLWWLTETPLLRAGEVKTPTTLAMPPSLATWPDHLVTVCHLVRHSPERQSRRRKRDNEAVSAVRSACNRLLLGLGHGPRVRVQGNRPRHGHAH